MNKTFEVTGTVRDSLSSVSKVEVQYSLNNSTWNKVADAVISDNIWTVNVPSGTYLPDAVSNENLYLRAIATDSLGNVVAAGNAPVLTVKIDQNKDRPTVKLSNIVPSLTPENASTIKKALTVHGSVTDDDGVSMVEISEDDGSHWTDIGASSGVFEFNPSNTDDGMKTVMFRITDAAGGVFTTGATALLQPYMTSSENAAVSNGTAKIYYMIDCTEPVIINDVVNVACSTVAAKEIKPSDKLGPQYESFTLTGSVSDISGIKSVTATSSATTVESVNAVLVQDNIDPTKYSFSIPMTFSATSASTTVSITIKAYDNSDLYISTTKTFVYDRSSPVIYYQKPNKDDLSAGAITIGGSTNDGDGETSGIASVQYMIPTRASAAGINAASAGWIDVSGTTTWSIDFTTYDSEAKKYPLDKFANSTYASLITEGEYADSNVWKLPVYFRVEDGAGNVSVFKDFYITLNPDADKPTTRLVVPVSSVQGNELVPPTVAGTVRITGTAEDNESVKAVYMAVDADNDSDFDAADIAWLNATGIYTVEQFPTVYDEDGITVIEPAWWGVKVDNTTSWSKTVNAGLEFYNGNNNDSTTVHFKFRSVDNNDKAGFWTSLQTVKFDPRAAEITEKKLVQYSDNVNGTGNILAEREYTDDMWIKGKWWLKITVEDSSALKSAQLIPSFASSVGNTNLSQKTYSFNYPIDSESLSGNSITFELDVNNEAGVATVTSFFINFDNTAPEIGELKHGEDNLTTIVQSDGSYQINTKVIESESNFDRMYMYFIRDTDGMSKRVYNSALSPLEKTVTRASTTTLSFTELGTDSDIKVGTKLTLGGLNRIITAINGNTATINAAVPTNETEAVFEVSRTDLTDSSGNAVLGFVFLDSEPGFVGIPAMQKTVTRAATNTVSYTGLSTNGNITPGTYVRLGGTDYKITSISGDVATLNGEVSKDYITAYFIYAAAIDHIGVETPRYSNPQNKSVVNDDYNGAGLTLGDFIAESVERSGTEYTTSAYINSVNIPDGVITVYCVAYDIAGNYAIQSKTATVENNGPKISKIYLGTDLDGNGSIENVVEDETIIVQEITEYDVTNGSNVTVVADGTGHDTDMNLIPAFKAKDITNIRLELLGGNGDLFYYLNINETDLAGHQKEALRTDGVTGAVNLSVDDLSAFDVTSETPAAVLNTVTVWDSTEEGTVGSTTLKAVANITYLDDVTDGVSPTTSISKFFWNAADDNSLYQNSKANGHIDLGGTWNASGDDAVSGKVVIRGKAHDESRLTSLKMYIDSYAMGNTNTGTETTTANTALQTAANYTNGAWVSNISGFSVTKDVMTQTGHDVEWQYIWDSSLIDGVAKNNINVHFTVTDKKNNTTDATNYQVDVVPYITGVVRPGKTLETTVRSRFGHNPVVENEVITINGFNLPTAKVTTADIESGIFCVSSANRTEVDATKLGTDITKVYSNTKTLTITVPASSGYLVASTNGVVSNNNINDNEAHGSSNAVSNGASSTVKLLGRVDYYNYEVDINRDDADLTTDYQDDRYLNVWNLGNHFNGTSTDDEFQKPVMTSDTSGNLFASWVAQSNGQVMFSYGLKQNVTPIYNTYDQPAPYSGVAFDKFGESSAASVAYIQEMQGNGGTWSNIGLSSATIVGGAAVTQITAADITAKKVYTGKTAVVTGNPSMKIDGSNTTGFYELACYDANRRLSAYTNPQAARYGNYLHNIWYDTVNDCIKYSMVNVGEENITTTWQNRGGAIAGWVVLDGGFTGQDRVHEWSTTAGSLNNTIGGASTNQTDVVQNNNSCIYPYNVFLANGTQRSQEVSKKFLLQQDIH
jgi:hypothetical protein